MATTIYGCDNPVTGQVDFDVCGTADFSACFEVAGDHAGQVKLIVSGTLCDDTYYGCYNSATGKYEVIIPDDCCCAAQMQLTLQNVIDCTPEGECPWPSDINGVHILDAIGSGCQTAFQKTTGRWYLNLDIDEGWVRAGVGEDLGEECWADFTIHTAFIACFTPMLWEENNKANEITCEEGECGNIDCNGNSVGCGLIIGESGTADWEIYS